MSTPKASQYYPALTGIRAVAAGAVFFYHVVQTRPTDQLAPLHQWATRLVQQGHVGVTLFFVLSGLLITLRYAGRVQLTGSWFRPYLQNRFARIYPVYLLLTVISFAVMMGTGGGDYYEWQPYWAVPDKLAALFLNLTLTRAFFAQMVVVGLPTAWSLTVEETFYLLAPVLLVGLKRDLRLLFFYPVALLGIAALLLALGTHARLPFGLLATEDVVLGRTFFGCCLPFLAGMGLAFFLPHVPRHRQGGRVTALGGVGVLAWVGVLAVVEHTAPAWYRLLVNLVAVPVVGLFWGLMTEKTRVQRLLSHPAALLLGQSSYVFYLIHMGVVDTYFGRWVSDHWAIRLLGLGLLSVVLYKWVEHPLHLKLKAKPQAKVLQAA